MRILIIAILLFLPLSQSTHDNTPCVPSGTVHLLTEHYCVDWVTVELYFEVYDLPICCPSPVYHWDMGDGTTYSTSFISHSYPLTSCGWGPYSWAATVDCYDYTISDSGVFDLSVPNPIMCDTNTISIGDLQHCINSFLGTEPLVIYADCSCDGTISIGELQRAINSYLAQSPSICD